MKKQNTSNPLNGKIIAIIITAIIIIAGTFFYFYSTSRVNGMAVNNQEKMNNDNKIDSNPSTPNMQNSQNSNSLIDHILSQNNIFIKINPDGNQKLFYYEPTNEQFNLALAEGQLSEYQIHSIGGQNYYPLIIGSDEAKIMRSEGLFTNIGDPIKGFFGKNVVVVGVMKRTGSILDMIHIIPLNSGELS